MIRLNSHCWGNKISVASSGSRRIAEPGKCCGTRALQNKSFRHSETGSWKQTGQSGKYQKVASVDVD